MPPKKTKAAGSSSQPPARSTRSISREPVSEAPRQTRGGRKRRHSDASNVSDRPSSSQSMTAPATTPSKRRKRGKSAVEADHELLEVPEMIEEEEEVEVLVDTQEPAAFGAEMESIEVSQSSKHVHFGAAPTQDDMESDDDVTKATATHITPHPRKMSVKRRFTASPGLGGTHSINSTPHSKRFKRTSLRHSLPPSLSQEHGDAVFYVEEREFAPLSEVLPERMTRRARFHKLVQELSTQTELGNNTRIAEIERELEELKEAHIIGEIEDVDTDMLDKDMLVLASQEEVAYPELPKDLSVIGLEDGDRKVVTTEEFSLRQSQSRSNEETWNVERKQMGDAIMSLSREANDYKTQLQILHIEAQGLNFTREGVETKVVLTSIREAFTHIRESLLEVLGDSVPETASNQDLINILVAHLTEYADRLRTQDNELFDKSTLAADLGKQVQGLLDHLADAELRKQSLEQQWTVLDASNDEKAREIEELQDKVEEVEQERDDLEDEHEVKITETNALQEENLEFARSIETLKKSLDSYRLEEQRLQELIARMEEEHKNTLVKMNQEREETVRDLEDRLHEQTGLRGGAEKQSEERYNTIITLELQVETVELERDSLREQLADVTVERDEEHDAREIAEADLQERSVEVEDLEGRVDRLENELTELNTQLEELRSLNETERTQREAAETDLDDRNQEIDELTEKLRTLGMQANELRQKLFEVQQANEHKIKELEQIASERDEQFQLDIADEVERREVAEELVQERASTIEELETRIDEVEQQMRGLLAERDERIEALEQEVAEKDGEIEGLRNDLLNAENLYDTQVAQSSAQREELESSIATLQITISEHERHVIEMQQKLVSTAHAHDSEIEDRNAQIAVLNHNIAEITARVTELESEKLSLERRVEEEAEQMLELQAENGDEIESLRAIINDKQAKILVVEEKAIETDRRWREVLDARDEEMSSLRASGEETEQTVTTLTTEIDTIKVKFRDYVRRASGKISNLQNALAEAKALADLEGDEIKEDGERMLEEFDSVSALATMTTTTTKTAHHSQEASAKKTRGRKKRVQDSGIGMEDESMIAS